MGLWFLMCESFWGLVGVVGGGFWGFFCFLGGGFFFFGFFWGGVFLGVFGWCWFWFLVFGCSTPLCGALCPFITFFQGRTSPRFQWDFSPRFNRLPLEVRNYPIPKPIWGLDPFLPDHRFSSADPHGFSKTSVSSLFLALVRFFLSFPSSAFCMRFLSFFI